MANIMEVSALHKNFVLARSLWGTPTQVLQAVRGVDFAIEQGSTVGMVGESGCGKSTIGRMLVGLYQQSQGKIYFKSKEKHGIKKEIQMVFQDPYASLNPRMTVHSIIEEPMLIHKLYATQKERDQRVRELLGLVGLKAEFGNRFPHEFSGGQRQRVGIARALAVNPEVIICDEPISALDVSIQAQVVNLLVKLQKDLGLTYLFIAHDLSMVRYISQKVLVMYLGEIVEEALTEDLYSNPLHPYTQALLSAIPIADPQLGKQRKRQILQGEIPNPLNPPQGCSFSTRCPLAKAICYSQAPVMKNIESRRVACHFA